jgi:DNA polymerase III alpha subunit (gram-positive type)
MSYFIVDVESDGPIPSDYSMVCFAAIKMDQNLDQSFYGKMKPISEKWIPEALAISGFTRDQTLSFDEPKKIMSSFEIWIFEHSIGKPIFVSDNNGYDWQFINWYFHHFIGKNPFGYSSSNLGSLYKGMVKDLQKNFKHLRKTIHSHDPLDDVKGNAEALLHMKNNMGLNIDLE